MTYASGGTVDRRELERVLDEVIARKVHLDAFANWIGKVLAADEIEVDEKDNALVWTIIEWLGDCIHAGETCDLFTWVARYRRVLAATLVNEDAETLLGFAGASDVLLDYLRRLTGGQMTRTEFNSAIDSRELWPPKLRSLMKSIPDRIPETFIAALEEDDYVSIARSLQIS